MKKTVLLLAGLAVTGSLYAGSIDYLSNQSADYLRTFSRNSSMDTDAVHYNPAATAQMKEGIYLHFTGQYIMKDYGAKLDTTGTTYDRDFKSDEPTKFRPSFYAVYNGGTGWAAFTGFHIIAGGGTVKFNDGVPMMVGFIPQIIAGGAALNPLINNATWDGGNLEASSLYPAFDLGGSYRIGDALAFSLTGRLVYATRTYKGKSSYSFFINTTDTGVDTTLEADAEENAIGFGGVIGASIKPNDNLNIGIRFETPVKLELETTVNDNKTFGPLFEDGRKRRKDLPATLGLGAGYSVGNLSFTTSLDVFFIGWADTSKDDASEMFYNDGYDDDYDSVGYEASLSAEYKVIPGLLKLSTGYMYNKVGGNKDVYSDFDFSLDSHSIGFGGVVNPMENLGITIGIGRIMYIDSKNSNDTVTYSKQVWDFALGIDYKI